MHSCTVVLWGLHDSDAHSWFVTREGQFGPEWPEALGPDRVPVVKGLDTAPRASSLPSSSWWERHCPYVPATAGQTLSVLGTQLARPHVPVHTPAATTARQEDPWPSRNCLRPQGSLSAPPFVTEVPCRDGRCLREVMRVWLLETLRPARGAASWEREDQTRTRKQSRPLMPFSPAAVTKYLVTGEMAEHRQPGHEELGRRALRRPPAGAPSPRILAGPVRARSACDHKASICLQHADGHLAPKSAACTDNTHSFRQK